jgi:hypothetical protein
MGVLKASAEKCYTMIIIPMLLVSNRGYRIALIKKMMLTFYTVDYGSKNNYGEKHCSSYDHEILRFRLRLS